MTNKQSWIEAAICVAAIIFVATLAIYVASVEEEQAKQARLWRCVIDDADQQSGIPRACIVPATTEKNARTRAKEICHWHDKRFYVLPMVANYPDVLQIEVTP